MKPIHTRWNFSISRMFLLMFNAGDLIHEWNHESQKVTKTMFIDVQRKGRWLPTKIFHLPQVAITQFKKWVSCSHFFYYAAHFRCLKYYFRMGKKRPGSYHPHSKPVSHSRNALTQFQNNAERQLCFFFGLCLNNLDELMESSSI